MEESVDGQRGMPALLFSSSGMKETSGHWTCYLPTSFCPLLWGFTIVYMVTGIL